MLHKENKNDKREYAEPRGPICFATSHAPPLLSDS
jgi:hypothetical protein